MNETIVINGVIINITTILSVIFCMIFLLLTIIHLIMMNKKVNKFKAPTLEQVKYGEETAKKIGFIHPSNLPLKEFEKQVNNFIEDFNKDTRLKNKIGASGYFTAFLVSLLSLYLSL
jgi:hypothetical protein